MHLGIGIALNYPNATINGLALDMSFMASSIPAGITFTRASSATDVIDGVLTSFSNDQPRISASNGLLIEGARTNSLRNSMMVGATAGAIGSGGALPTNWLLNASGGITTTIIGTGTVNGFTYIDIRFNGTPAANNHQVSFESGSQVAAAQGEIWAASAWVAMVGGSLTNISSVDIRSCELASGSFVTANQANYPTLTSTLQHMAVNRTMASGVTHAQARVRLNLTVSAAIDITLRIAAPQLELGSGATSFIPTSGSAATRANDICDFSNVTFLTQGIGTWFTDAVCAKYAYDTALSVNARVIDMNPASSSNTMGIVRSNTTNKPFLQCTSNSVLQFTLSPASQTWSLGTRMKICSRYDSAEAAGTCTGSGEIITDNTIPDGIPVITAISIGRRGSSTNSGWLNGYIRGLKYYSRKLTDAEMLAMVV